MKGLLLKDLYMAKRYCRAYLLVAAVFLAVAVSGTGDSLFFLAYPCLFSGMIPVTLLAYDERCGFPRYAGSLPPSKAEYVSGKYLIGLIAQLGALILTAAACGVRLAVTGSFAAGAYFALLMVLGSASVLTSSLTLPFMFRWGVEKGRIAYYAAIGIVFGACAVMGKLLPGNELNRLKAPVTACAPLIAAAILALSWRLSVKAYEGREV